MEILRRSHVYSSPSDGLLSMGRFQKFYRWFLKLFSEGLYETYDFWSLEKNFEIRENEESSEGD